MTKEQEAAWAALRDPAERGWAVDFVWWANRGDRLVYTDAVDGAYVLVKPDGTIEVGTYTGALQNIGDAAFRVCETIEPGTIAPDRVLLERGVSPLVTSALAYPLPIKVYWRVRGNVDYGVPWDHQAIASLTRAERKAAIGIPDDEPLNGAFAAAPG